jgi:hypothetical protein
MSYRKYLEYTAHQLKSEIGNLEQRRRELSERISEMTMALSVVKSPLKLDEVVMDKRGRRGVVSADEGDPRWLKVTLYKLDGTLGQRSVTLFDGDKWTKE